MDGESPEASVVGGADRCGVPEPGPCLHRDPARGGGLALSASADLGLPALPYGGVDPFGDGLGRVFAFALAVALHRPLADPDLLGNGFGRLELLHQEVDARLQRLGRLAGEGFPVGPLDGVLDLCHGSALLDSGVLAAGAGRRGPGLVRRAGGGHGLLSFVEDGVAALDVPGGVVALFHQVDCPEHQLDAFQLGQARGGSEAEAAGLRFA